MTLSSTPLASSVAPPPPSVVPRIVVGDGSVVALRRRAVITPGALLERSLTNGDHLVAARDVAGRGWWIPADTVWSDAEVAAAPQHPCPVGLATGRTMEAAILAGTSDRLGWEAVVEHERGRHLPVLDGRLARGALADVTVLDGRLDHDVPTVVILGRGCARWGAGATWEGALHRALYGEDGRTDHPEELSTLVQLLARRGIGVVAVDLATPLIRRAGVVRFSVQFLASDDDPGRTWDAPALD